VFVLGISGFEVKHLLHENVSNNMLKLSRQKHFLNGGRKHTEVLFIFLFI